jgi:hypothetical protein
MPGEGNGNVLSAYVGRNQGPEFFTSTPHNGVAQSVLIPRNLSINRPLEAIILRWRGRVAVTVANLGAVAAEAPQTIINRIIVQGTFKGTALTPISLTGATAFARGFCYDTRGSSAYINGVLQASPGVPFGQTLANFGNIGNYDLDIWYVIPTWPIIAAGRRAADQVPYLWQPQDWADSIQVRLELGDQTSFGTVGGATVTFTAFGSAAGSPLVEIYTRYTILASLRSSFHTACQILNENTINSGVASVASNVRLMPLQKQKTTNVLVKTGVILTGTSPQVQVFASLSDVMLDRTLIVVDNKYIRNNQTNLAAKESVGYNFSTREPQGYLPFSFVDGQSARTAFRADLPTVVGSGSTFDLMSDIISAGANQQVNVVQEMLFADANDPYWAGTR